MIQLRASSGPSSPIALERSRLVSYAKIGTMIVGVVVHMPPATWSEMSKAMAWQHILMFVPYGLSGAVDLLERRGRLGPQSTLLTLVLALSVTIVLFLGHGNLAGLESTAHRLLVGFLLTALAATALELVQPAPLARWARATAILAAGCWFNVIGWVLYLSGWDTMDPVNDTRLYALWAATATLSAVIALAMRVSAPRTSTA
jgi:hypothetical protein